MKFTSSQLACVCIRIYIYGISKYSGCSASRWSRTYHFMFLSHPYGLSRFTFTDYVIYCFNWLSCDIKIKTN